MKRTVLTRVLKPTVLHKRIAAQCANASSNDLSFDYYAITPTELCLHNHTPNIDPLIRNGAVVFKSAFDRLHDLSFPAREGMMYTVTGRIVCKK